jgi:hypothetical protein
MCLFSRANGEWMNRKETIRKYQEAIKRLEAEEDEQAKLPPPPTAAAAPVSVSVAPKTLKQHIVSGIVTPPPHSVPPRVYATFEKSSSEKEGEMVKIHITSSSLDISCSVSMVAISKLGVHQSLSLSLSGSLIGTVNHKSNVFISDHHRSWFWIRFRIPSLC